jgi:hypothetical protein
MEAPWHLVGNRLWSRKQDPELKQMFSGLLFTMPTGNDREAGEGICVRRHIPAAIGENSAEPINTRRSESPLWIHSAGMRIREALDAGIRITTVERENVHKL